MVIKNVSKVLRSHWINRKFKDHLYIGLKFKYYLYNFPMHSVLLGKKGPWNESHDPRSISPYPNLSRGTFRSSPAQSFNVLAVAAREGKQTSRKERTWVASTPSILRAFVFLSTQFQFQEPNHHRQPVKKPPISEWPSGVVSDRRELLRRRNLWCPETSSSSRARRTRWWSTASSSARDPPIATPTARLLSWARPRSGKAWILIVLLRSSNRFVSFCSS